MKKRVFIGIKVGSELASEVISWQERYKGKFNVRWISKDNLHITLTPPWYEENIEGIIDKLAKMSFRLPSFGISFQKVAFGSQQRAPRLIWAEGLTPNEMFELKNLIEKTLNIKPEKRELKLHLTIARFRESYFKLFTVKKIENKISWKMKVNSFCLFESKLFPTGAEYSVLKEFRL